MNDFVFSAPFFTRRYRYYVDLYDHVLHPYGCQLYKPTFNRDEWLLSF